MTSMNTDIHAERERERVRQTDRIREIESAAWYPLDKRHFSHDEGEGFLFLGGGEFPEIEKSNFSHLV